MAADQDSLSTKGKIYTTSFGDSEGVSITIHSTTSSLFGTNPPPKCPSTYRATKSSKKLTLETYCQTKVDFM